MLSMNPSLTWLSRAKPKEKCSFTWWLAYFWVWSGCYSWEVPNFGTGHRVVLGRCKYGQFPFFSASIFFISTHSSTYKAIKEKSPPALYPNSSKKKRRRLKNPYGIWIPYYQGLLCGLAFWFMQSPLQYGPGHKGAKKRVFSVKRDLLQHFCGIPVQMILSVS